jgi:hypothetical protein
MVLECRHGRCLFVDFVIVLYMLWECRPTSYIIQQQSLQTENDHDDIPTPYIIQ